MATKYLKKDGSLDAKSKLSPKEYSDYLCNLTHEQYKEYVSKLPIKESQNMITPIVVENVDAYLKELGAVNIWDIIDKLRK